MKLLREWWPIIVAVITAVGLYFAIDRTLLFGFWPSFALSGIEAETRANLGALGDVMGGLLNPVLTFITIILLIQTIRISQKTLRQTEASLKISDKTLKATKEQIELNRQELAETREEIAKSSAAQQQMARTQIDQKKESAFYEIFSQFSNIVLDYATIPEAENTASNRLNKVLTLAFKRSKEDDFVAQLGRSLKARGDLMLSIRLLICLYDLADDNDELKRVLCSIITKDYLVFLAMFAWYSDSTDAEKVKKLLGDRKLIPLDVVIYTWGGSGKPYFDKAMQALQLSHIS